MSQVILSLDARMKIQGLPSPGSEVLFLPIFCNVYYPPAPYKTNQEFIFFLRNTFLNFFLLFKKFYFILLRLLV